MAKKWPHSFAPFRRAVPPSPSVLSPLLLSFAGSARRARSELLARARSGPWCLGAHVESAVTALRFRLYDFAE